MGGALTTSFTEADVIKAANAEHPNAEVPNAELPSAAELPNAAEPSNADDFAKTEISMTMSRRHAIVSAFADAARDVGQERVVENMRPYLCETSYKNDMLRFDLLKIRDKRRRKGSAGFAVDVDDEPPDELTDGDVDAVLELFSTMRMGF